MSWNAITVFVKNESTFDLKVSPSETVTENAEFVAEEEMVLGDIKPDRDSRYIKFKRTTESGPAAGCLTFTFGEPAKKLIVWIWMAPNVNMADIKIAVYDATVEINPDFLNILTRLALSGEEINLYDDFGYELEFEDRKHIVGVLAKVNYEELPEDKKDWYNETFGPNATFRVREVGYEVKPELPADPDKREFKIKAGGVGANFTQPVHENMTLAALIAAGLVPKGKTYNETRSGDQATYEYLRGVVWNDDPACALFNDNPNDNSDFGSGAEWFAAYKKAAFPPQNAIIVRSHYGDLQFLHAMACAPREPAAETRRKVKLWIEIMYKLCVGDGISESTVIRDTLLSEFFSSDSARGLPSGAVAPDLRGLSLRDLLLGNTKRYTKADIPRRALGSLFHTVQDSYAVGHCAREIQDKSHMEIKYLSVQTMDATKQMFKAMKDFLSDPFKNADTPFYVMRKKWSFPKDNPPKLTKITNFHSYDGQDEDSHGHYDEADNPEELNPSLLESFNTIIGARDAITVCQAFASYAATRTKWTDGPEGVFEKAFELAGGAGDSNVEVDQPLGPLPADAREMIKPSDIWGKTKEILQETVDKITETIRDQQTRIENFFRDLVPW